MVYILILYVTFSVFLALMAIRIIQKLATKWDSSYTCLVGKTVIVTGSNTGIGYYTALDLAKRGAKVILACRNNEKGETARKEITDATGNPNVSVRLIDFASLASVRRFAQEIRATEDRVDILVNNAGLGWLDDIKTEDGLNYLIQVNHFGPFLLTNLLLDGTACEVETERILDLIKKSAPSRIVSVSSTVSHLAKLDPDDLNAFPAGRFGKLTNYANSKLLNVLFANELARKVEGTGVTSNSLHPGAVQTGLFRYFSKPFKQIFLASARLSFKTAEEGAQTSIYVSVSKELEHISGEYFENCGISWLPGMPRAARDASLGERVWRASEDILIGVSTDNVF